MKPPFRVPAQIMGIRALADGGLALNIHTKELAKEEKTEVFEYQLKAGWLLFAENPINESDIPSQPAEYEGKTPSQRLRAVLFLIWKQEGQKGNFEEYYHNAMERFINHCKNKLL